jgi:aspartokinase
MSNIVQKVWKILDNNPSIKRDLSLGLINTSALARYLIEKNKVEGTLDGVIGAIRRYDHGKHKELFLEAYKLLGQTVNLFTRRKVAEIALKKDEDVQQLLPKLFGIIKYIQGDVLRIMQANESIRLLIDEKNLERVTNIFPKDKILVIEKNLAEIDIYIHPEMQETPGILAVIANELTINGINIVEVMTCPPEMLFIVKGEDLLQAHDVLNRLCQTQKNDV